MRKSSRRLWAALIVTILLSGFLGGRELWVNLSRKYERMPPRELHYPSITDRYYLLVFPKQEGHMYTIFGARYHISGPGCHIFIMDNKFECPIQGTNSHNQSLQLTARPPNTRRDQDPRRARGS